MYLIVGLGNPEEKYANTRHNMGFETINQLSKKFQIEVNKTKFDSLYGKGEIEGEKVILVKPQTYMNLSGVAVKKFINFYKLPIENVIIIYDDLDIEAGIIKVRKKGGPGTHNGMKSVVNEIKVEDFLRIRIGIGMTQNKEDLLNYLLDKIPDNEYSVLKIAIQNAVDAICEILKNGVDSSMNKYN